MDSARPLRPVFDHLDLRVQHSPPSTVPGLRARVTGDPVALAKNATDLVAGRIDLPAMRL
jgi:hypothetical protein